MTSNDEVIEVLKEYIDTKVARLESYFVLRTLEKEEDDAPRDVQAEVHEKELNEPLEEVEDLQEVVDEIHDDSMSDWQKGFVNDMKEKAEKYNGVVKVSAKQMKYVEMFKHHLGGIAFQQWEDRE